eukprot:303937-Chlamydomonas_euryale.AAC.1
MAARLTSPFHQPAPTLLFHPPAPPQQACCRLRAPQQACSGDAPPKTKNAPRSFPHLCRLDQRLLLLHRCDCLPQLLWAVGQRVGVEERRDLRC